MLENSTQNLGLTSVLPGNWFKFSGLALCVCLVSTFQAFLVESLHNSLPSHPVVAPPPSFDKIQRFSLLIKPQLKRQKVQVCRDLWNVKTLFAT